MIFVAVALPRLARNDMSFFKASLEGNYKQHGLHTMVDHSIQITTSGFVGSLIYHYIDMFMCCQPDNRIVL